MIAYVTGLTLFGGTVVGVLPALNATRRAYGNLQQLASHGSSMKLGHTWTALIIAQVAIPVAILPASLHHATLLLRAATVSPGYPAEQFVRASITLDREDAPSSVEATGYQSRLDARFASGAEAILQRIASEPGVSASFVSASPGGEPDKRFEIQGDSSVTNTGVASSEKTATVRASVTLATTGLFDLFDGSIVAGRKFVEAESADSTAVIVDTAFAARFPSRNVIGQRIRSIATRRAPAGQWLEIVGVVADPPPASTDTDDIGLPNVYFASTPNRLQEDGLQATSIRLRMRVRAGLTPAFSKRLRATVVAINPNFKLQHLSRDSDILSRGGQKLRTTAFAVAGVTLSVLLFSAAGIYAMLSFTVAQRRREIGIRAALGANPQRIVSSIFARASAQLGTGVALGLIVALVIEKATNGQLMGGGSSAATGGLRGAVVLMPIVAAIVMVVGLLAALGPARRGLAVQPLEALRRD